MSRSSLKDQHMGSVSEGDGCALTGHSTDCRFIAAVV